jgi:hypothetical protein
MEEQVEVLTVAPAPESLAKRNPGWFLRGDGRINREGRPRGSKAGLPKGVAPKELAARADRVMRLFVPAREFACHLSGREAPWVANLPEDFVIVAGRFDPERDGFVLTIRSRTFPRVARGAPVPEFAPEAGNPSTDLAPCDDRLMLLVVPAREVMHRYGNQHAPWLTNLPRDAAIVASRLDPVRQVVVLVIRSGVFPKVARGTPIPEFTPAWNGLKWAQR